MPCYKQNASGKEDEYSPSVRHSINRLESPSPRERSKFLEGLAASLPMCLLPQQHNHWRSVGTTARGLCYPQIIFSFHQICNRALRQNPQVHLS